MSKNFLRSYQKEVTKEVKKIFDQKIKQTKQPFLRDVLKLLKEFSLRPAKRIRAILIIQGFLSAGGKSKKAILEMSAFIELIHNYLLIHDDIIDQDRLRRGGETLHYQYQKLSNLRRKRKERYGQAMAIVGGDLMASLGYEILTSANLPNNYKIRAIKKLNEILFAVCYGQMLELKTREKIIFNKKIKENEIFEIYLNKTAQYSFVGPLQIGAILAGAGKETLGKLEKFARPLGIAFQIKDDLSDLKADTREQQPTLFRAKASLPYCQKVIKDLTGQSKKYLNQDRGFPQKEKQFLLDLIDYIFEN